MAGRLLKKLEIIGFKKRLLVEWRRLAYKQLFKAFGIGGAKIVGKRLAGCIPYVNIALWSYEAAEVTSCLNACSDGSFTNSDRWF